MVPAAVTIAGLTRNALTPVSGRTPQHSTCATRSPPLRRASAFWGLRMGPCCASPQRLRRAIGRVDSGLDHQLQISDPVLRRAARAGAGLVVDLQSAAAKGAGLGVIVGAEGGAVLQCQINLLAAA